MKPTKKIRKGGAAALGNTRGDPDGGGVIPDKGGSRKSLTLRNYLSQCFPECVSDGKINFDMLKASLGELVEKDRERYELVWSGKSDCMRIVQEPSRATLVPEKDKSVNFDNTNNIIIEGENLEVLKLLQESYFGKIKMIYIDPPYNTGQEFIYPDKFGESLEVYLAYTGQIDAEGHRFSANSEKSGRFHTRWLNMLFPRLYLARNLLREDGAIFISIDDHEHSNLRKICDEIFGEENFLADIAWQKRYTRNNSTHNFATVIEHVLAYSKSDAFQVNLLPRTKEANSRYSNPDNDPRGKWMTSRLYGPATPQERPNLCYKITNPKTGKSTVPTAHAWRYSQEHYEQLQRENRLYWGPDGTNPVPHVKNYLSEARDLTPMNFWCRKYAGDTDGGTKDLEAVIPGKVFEHPKPVKLVRYMLEHACTGTGEIVLDFFAGSFVTAQAVIEKNTEDGCGRNYILVQLPEPVPVESNARKEGYSTISEIGIARIHKVSMQESQKMLASLPQAGRESDLGFRVFRLAQSNFKKWNLSGEDITVDEVLNQLDLHTEILRDNHEPGAVIFETILEAGLPLSTKVSEIEVAGKTIVSVADQRILICLEKNLTTELVERLADMNPQQVVFLDESFSENDQLKANTIQTFRARARVTGTEVIVKIL